MPRGKDKRQGRPNLIVGFKAFFDTDQDILKWWEGMEAGKRGYVLRSLVRSHIAASEASELSELRQEVRQLSDRIARLSNQIASGVTISGNGRPHEELDEQQAEKRARQILSRKW